MQNIIFRLKRHFQKNIQIEKNNIVGTTNKAFREEWLESALSQIPADSRILDAGAGELQYKKFCSHLNYVSQDFGQYTGTGDEKALQTKQWDNSKLDIVCDIINIPEPDASFDAVMCVEVFEHLPAPIDALRELSRLLKPGGHLILTAPFNSLTHFSPYFYHTGFSEYFYQHWCNEFGLEIIDLQKNGNYFEYMAQEIRRIESTAKKYADYSINDQERNAIHTLINSLQTINQSNNGSEELLCFGMHILARKL